MDDVDALLDRLCENGGDEYDPDLADGINDETFGEMGAYDGETFASEESGQRSSTFNPRPQRSVLKAYLKPQNLQATICLIFLR
jgi:hypothetical protein